MDHLARNELLERILGASRPVVLLRGPAATGKTGAVLGLYRHFLDKIGQPRCLILAPNGPAVSSLRRQLLASSPSGAILSPGVLTFAALAERILAAAGDGGKRLSNLQRNLLLRRIVNDLSGTGKLPSLSAVADTPGIVAALDRAIAELKRCAIEPEALAKAIGPQRDKHRDLLEVYRRYQRQLREAGAYDVEGLMWQGRDHLAGLGEDRSLPGMEHLEALAVDGFTDFTPTQLEIIALVGRRLKRVLITLPWADDGRERMWHWTARTLDQLKKAFGADLEEIVLDSGSPGVGAPGMGEPGVAPAAEVAAGESPQPLKCLRDKVFLMDAPAGELPRQVQLIRAAGVEAEVAAVARRVKRRLLDGASCGSIAVLARSLEAYRPAIERIFARHDIPVSLSPQPLTAIPIIRFALDAISLPGGDFAFQDVLAVIKNSYFRPQALGDFDDQTVAAAEMLIRQGNVLGSRASYAETARRLIRRAQRGPTEGEEEEVRLGPLLASPQTVAAAAEMLEKLFDLTQRALGAPAGAAAPHAAPGAGGLGAIVEGLQLRQALWAPQGALGAPEGTACRHDDPELLARDLRALAALDEALGQVEGQCSLGELIDALASAACPPARGESLVDVLDVLDARANRYQHVFLLGLNEHEFPRRFSEGSLIGEADRLTWAHRGAALDSRADLTAREMLLFYLALTRADASLTLSYLECDSSGAAKAPSNFLLSLMEGFGGLEHCPLERIAIGTFLPRGEQIATAADAFNAAVAGLFEADAALQASLTPQDAQNLLAWAAREQPAKLAQAAMGIYARHRRWSQGPCDGYDGRITEAPLLDLLGRRFPDQTVFSASQLETYARCPWAYFAQYVLALEALAEPQRRLEAVSRGLFIHEALFGVMTLLRRRLGSPVRLSAISPADLDKTLDEVVQAKAGQMPPPRYPILWTIQLAQMVRELRAYLHRQQEETAWPSESLHFELAFATREDRPDEIDPASAKDPVLVQTSAGAIRVRGRIDRVDHVSFEGLDGLMVIDYKTGRLPSKDDLRQGRNVQVLLYCAAVEQILGRPGLGGAFHRIADVEGKTMRFFAAIDCRGGKYKLVEDFDQARKDVLAKIGQFVSDMRSGRFDLMPEDRCPSYCPFRQICHFSPSRAEVKSAPEGRP